LFLSSEKPEPEKPEWVKQAKQRHAAHLAKMEGQEQEETKETTTKTGQKVIQKRGVPPEGESSVHGREVHVAKQKQTQKEVSVRIPIRHT